ncbi:MAG: glycosyltransferase family 4 protein [Pseudomonadota bacterium]
MKVVFVNRFFYPDHSATSQMLSDVVFQLAEDGVSCTVITSRLRYDDPTAELKPMETIKGVRVVRVWTSRFGRNRLAGRLFDYLSFYVTAAWSMLTELRSGDCLVVKTDPPMLSVIAAPIAWVRQVRLINWLQDVFPEVAERLADRRSGVLSRVIFGGLRRLRNWSLRRASINVVLGKRMASFLREQGISDDRMRIIPNWSDGRRIQPVPRADNRLRHEWDLTSAFVVGYSGNLGRAHDIATMVDAIKRTQMEDGAARAGDDADVLAETPVKWVFIGGGASMSALKREVETAGLRHVQFHPYQPREVMSESLSVADVHLVSLRPALEGLIVPSKSYGIAAAGRPILFIGNADGEIGQLVREADIGRCVREGDGAALGAAILEMAKDTQWVTEAGIRARRVFEEQFDFPTAVAAWHDVLQTRSQCLSD